MPFESPQLNHQKDLLNEINSTLKKIQLSVDSLNQRIIANSKNNSSITYMIKPIYNIQTIHF